MAYCTADQVKVALRLPITDTSQDDQITRAIAAASAQIDKHCKRSFALVASTSRLYVPVAQSLLLVDDIPDDSVVVETRSGVNGTWSTMSSTLYQLEPLNNLSGGRYWPIERIRAVGGAIFPSIDDGTALIRVTAAFGWETTPAEVTEAAVLQAVRIVKRPDAPFGVTFGELGAISVQKGLDPDVAELLSPYVRTSGPS